MSKKIETAENVAMSAKEFKQASYDAYIAYVKFIEDSIDVHEAVKAMSPIMAKYGFDLNYSNIASVLTVKMTAFGTDNGEKAKKVKSIATFRAFIKGGWRDVVNAPVHAKAGKNPADGKQAKTEKAKKMTKSDLEETVKTLMAKIAEMEKTA